MAVPELEVGRIAVPDRRSRSAIVVDPRPADRRLDQRLHGQPLGPAQAVHRRRRRCSTLVFLLGIATANSRPDARRLRALLLAFSTNIARGPFQGYVPGSRPRRARSGIASAMVGLMQILGNVVGLRWLVTIAVAAGTASSWRSPRSRSSSSSTMVSVVCGSARACRRRTAQRPLVALDRRRDLGHRHPPRAVATSGCSRRACSSSWAARCSSTSSSPTSSRPHGLDEDAANAAYLIDRSWSSSSATSSRSSRALATLRSDRPEARHLRQLRRSASSGVADRALAPSVPLPIVGAALFGASAGTFLAVDWALMTDIIPRASSGRYMGLSNVATASSTIVRGRDRRARARRRQPARSASGPGRGPRYLLGAVYYVVAALTLRPVVEPDRRRLAAAAGRLTPPPSSSAPSPRYSRHAPAERRRRWRTGRRSAGERASATTTRSEPVERLRPRATGTGRAPTGRRGSRAGAAAPRSRTAPRAGGSSAAASRG